LTGPDGGADHETYCGKSDRGARRRVQLARTAWANRAMCSAGGSAASGGGPGRCWAGDGACWQWWTWLPIFP